MTGAHRAAALVGALASVCLPAAARAASEEIQVYMDELNRPGEIGLDVHLNDVLTGDGAPDYPGAESSLHRLRITPEFSLGITNTLELGAYLPLATLSRDGTVRVDGVKLRLKYLAPHKEEGFYWGANLELGKVSRRLDVNPYNGAGPLRGLGHFGSSEQTTFAVADTHIGRFEVNAGLGKGYGANADATILKFAIGVPIGPKHTD